ncbi:unnamed protein product [Cylindrotheca closterium]|uniref:Uncharacterized protein n=1 Tax=Cylindrotheca closterium TaxID=2856 RepID=A0AAD2FFI9_9STRA|nr:unnamed protein product [Cylindrotheca closterium]
MLFQYLRATVFSCLCCLCLCSRAYATDEVGSKVISATEHVHDSEHGTVGLIRTYHDASYTESPCSAMILLGVGTSMSIRDYDKLSTRIAAGSSIVVVIMDHNEHFFQKTSPEKYARLVNAIRSNISSLVSICKNQEPLFLIGGHSSSGEAAIMTLENSLLGVNPDGWVGLDPYDMSPETIGNDAQIKIPSINWGFAKTTCLVATDKAAKAAFELADPGARVLYQINNNENDCKITHCVFSDHGCGIICSSNEENDWVPTVVARSINLFVNAVAGRIPFDRSHFQLDLENRVRLYMNDEQFE